jgi:hypothetical protein
MNNEKPRAVAIKLTEKSMKAVVGGATAIGATPITIQPTTAILPGRVMLPL